jgi:hypothetical protein
MHIFSFFFCAVDLTDTPPQPLPHTHTHLHNHHHTQKKTEQLGGEEYAGMHVFEGGGEEASIETLSKQVAEAEAGVAAAKEKVFFFPFSSFFPP